MLLCALHEPGNFLGVATPSTSLSIPSGYTRTNGNDLFALRVHVVQTLLKPVLKVNQRSCTVVVVKRMRPWSLAAPLPVQVPPNPTLVSFGNLSDPRPQQVRIRSGSPRNVEASLWSFPLWPLSAAGLLDHSWSQVWCPQPGLKGPGKRCIWAKAARRKLHDPLPTLMIYKYTDKYCMK